MTLLENFLKNKRVQKTLSARQGEEGFSLVELVVVIAVLAILSAVAIPAFVGVQARARASAVKNGLVNGVKECVVRAADFDTTNFADAQSFSGGIYQGYTIEEEAVAGDTCYAATATADPTSGDSNFTIIMNAQTGLVSRTCTDVTAAGCSGDVVTTTDPVTNVVTTTTDGTW